MSAVTDQLINGGIIHTSTLTLVFITQWDSERVPWTDSGFVLVDAGPRVCVCVVRIE